MDLAALISMTSMTPNRHLCCNQSLFFLENAGEVRFIIFRINAATNFK
jgi:hypothetical protein